MTISVQSFIDATVTDMAEKSNKLAAIAREVQKQQHDNVANRIAMAYVSLSNKRRLASRTGNEVRVKPELMLNFLQSLMNGICWNARRLKQAQLEHETQQQAVGVDFSADVAAELHVETVATDNIGEVVEYDHFVLSNVQTWLASKMSYLTEIEELHLFADHDYDEEADEWVLRASAATFAEAEALMENLVLELAEAEEVKSGTEAAALDFGNVA